MNDQIDSNQEREEKMLERMERQRPKSAVETLSAAFDKARAEGRVIKEPEKAVASSRGKPKMDAGLKELERLRQKLEKMHYADTLRASSRLKTIDQSEHHTIEIETNDSELVKGDEPRRNKLLLLGGVRAVVFDVMRRNKRARTDRLYLLLKVLQELGFHVYIPEEKMGEMPALESITRYAREYRAEQAVKKSERKTFTSRDSKGKKRSISFKAKKNAKK